MTQAQPIRRSSRTAEVLRSVLQSWLGARLGVAPEVSDVAGTDANGMSSDTVLFRAAWHEDGRAHDEALVARIAPDAGDVPVFPSYDMRGQFDTIRPDDAFAPPSSRSAARRGTRLARPGYGTARCRRGRPPASGSRARTRSTSPRRFV